MRRSIPFFCAALHGKTNTASEAPSTHPMVRKKLTPQSLLQVVRRNPGLTATYYCTRYFPKEDPFVVKQMFWTELKRFGHVLNSRQSRVSGGGVEENEEDEPRWIPNHNRPFAITSVRTHHDVVHDVTNLGIDPKVAEAMRQYETTPYLEKLKQSTSWYNGRGGPRNDTISPDDSAFASASAPSPPSSAKKRAFMPSGWDDFEMDLLRSSPRIASTQQDIATNQISKNDSERMMNEDKDLSFGSHTRNAPKESVSRNTASKTDKIGTTQARLTEDDDLLPAKEAAADGVVIRDTPQMREQVYALVHKSPGRDLQQYAALLEPSFAADAKVNRKSLNRLFRKMKEAGLLINKRAPSIQETDTDAEAADSVNVWFVVDPSNLY